MITVACCHWGNYPEPGWETTYIRRLKNSVDRHLEQAHHFICFAEDSSKVPEEVEYRPLNPPSWKWNFPKTYVYSPEAGLEGRVLLFDLDNVIVGSLDEMAAYHGDFCVKAQWPAFLEGRYVPDGDMISFDANGPSRRFLWEKICEETERLESKHKGKERFFIQEVVPGADTWQKVIPGQLKSYKHDLVGARGLPRDTRIVTFHGKPRQHECNEPWIEEHWR